MSGSSDAAFRRSVGTAVLASVLFALLFSFHSSVFLDFWWWMSLNIFILCVLSFTADRGYGIRIFKDIKKNWPEKTILGLMSAGLLYGIFFLGKVTAGFLPPFALEGIDKVYSFKEGIPVLRVVLLMALIIGPGEEVFWRGYLQRTWQAQWGKTAGWLGCTALYTLVHVPSGNIILITAALTAGLCWGGLYTLTRSTLLVAVSHTVWDLLVFVVFPL